MREGDRVRLAVLGLGSIAQVVHLPVLSQLKTAELTGVCDVDRAKARAIAARFGVTNVFQSDADVFRSPDVDAVVICTPNHLHESQAIAALQGGKHVLVEKPLALSAEGAAKVVETAAASGRGLQVAMNNRFRADCQALRPFVQGGELGEIFLARGAWLNRKTRVLKPTWRHRRATAGGGAFMDLGVQVLDLALWFLGFPAVASVHAEMRSPAGIEVEDSASVQLRLARGGSVVLSVSWSLVGDRDLHDLRLLGSRGSGAIAPLAVFKELDAGIIDVTPQLPAHRENLYTMSYRSELQYFVETIRAGAPPPTPVEQVELMRLVSLAYRSAAEKREVEA